MQESLAFLKPLNDHLALLLCLKELIELFDDLLFDVLGCGILRGNTEKNVKELLPGLRNSVQWKEEVDESSRILHLILHRVFAFLVWQVLKKEVEEVGGAQLLVEDLLPHVSPDQGAGQGVIDFETVLLETLKGVLVKADFSVHVVALIQDHALDWAIVAKLMKVICRDEVGRIRITQNEVFDRVKLVILVVDANVDFRLPEAVLSCWVDKLLDFEMCERFILVKFDRRLERIDSTRPQPLIAPILELEVGAHARVVLGVVRFLKGSDEIGELRVLPLVLLEVDMEGVLHALLAEDLVRLL